MLPRRFPNNLVSVYKGFCKKLTFFIFVLGIVLSVQGAETKGLEIQPRFRPIRKELGENLVLACRPNVPNPELITNLEWRDKNNRRIENSHRSGPMYIQVKFIVHANLNFLKNECCRSLSKVSSLMET